jgi:hypothetical protein
LKRDYKINDVNTYNINKSGLQISDLGQEIVLVDANTCTGLIVVQELSCLKWNTALEYISALGDKIDPLIIFTAKNL